MGASLGVVLWHLGGRDRRRLVVASLVGVSPYLVHLATAGPGQRRARDGDRAGVRPAGRPGPAPAAQRAPTSTASSSGPAPSTSRPWPFPSPTGPRPAQPLARSLLGGGVRAPRSWAGWRAHRDGRTRLLVMAAFAAGLVPQALQRADSTHLAWVSCVTLGASSPPRSRARPGDRLPERLRTVARRRPPARAPRWPSSRTSPRAPTPRPSGQTFGYRRNALSHGARGPRVPLRPPRRGRGRQRAPPGRRRDHRAGRPTSSSAPATCARRPYSEAFLYYLLPDLDPGDPLHRDGPGRGQRRPTRAWPTSCAAADVVDPARRSATTGTSRTTPLVDGPDEPNQVLARRLLPRRRPTARDCSAAASTRCTSGAEARRTATGRVPAVRTLVVIPTYEEALEHHRGAHPRARRGPPRRHARRRRQQPRRHRRPRPGHRRRARARSTCSCARRRTASATPTATASGWGWTAATTCSCRWTPTCRTTPPPCLRCSRPSTTAPRPSSGRATCRAARCRTGRGTGGPCRSGATATPASCSA